MPSAKMNPKVTCGLGRSRQLESRVGSTSEHSISNQERKNGDQKVNLINFGSFV